MMPLMADTLLESIRLLANGVRLFAKDCVAGTEADRERLPPVYRAEFGPGDGVGAAGGFGYEAAARVA